jgi:hypothetical protein
MRVLGTCHHGSVEFRFLALLMFKKEEASFSSRSPHLILDHTRKERYQSITNRIASREPRSF